VGSAALQGTFQAPVAAVLHEDVRYISSSQHAIKRRVGHAVLYSFLTYNNQGHGTLNIANLSAYYASTAVSTAWLPGIRKRVRYTFSNATEQIALSVPINVVQEFWPEIQHYVFRRHKPQSAAGALECGSLLPLFPASRDSLLTAQEPVGRLGCEEAGLKKAAASCGTPNYQVNLSPNLSLSRQ
jgi:hypothetical protein